ncbi:MAG: hypothetical protein QM606_07260 [Leucobacter sp.]
MDLKFTFGGASPDHGHAADDRGDAPSGIPLPFAATPALSTSSVLEVRVRRDGEGLRAEAVSGDGVVYCHAEVPVRDQDAAALARAVRSAVSRAVAELEGRLADSIAELRLQFGDDGPAVIDALGFPSTSTPAEGTAGGATSPGTPSGDDAPAVAVTSDAFQRRTGIASGTPVRIV